MILRHAAALQDRWLRYRYRRPPSRAEREAWYRERRLRVLAAVLAWTLIRRLAR
jgi:hypothetical protein